MAYTITTTDGSLTITIPSGQFDNTTSLTLPGANSVGYGSALNENLVHLLENFSGNTAPAGNNLPGQLWFDYAHQILKVFTSTGQGYVPVSGISVATLQPSNPSIGNIWFNSNTGQMYLYDGLAWNLVGPIYTKAQGVSGAVPLQVLGTDSVEHNVIQLQYGGEILAIFSDTMFVPTTAITGFPVINGGLTINSAYNQPLVNVVYSNANVASYLAASTDPTIQGINTAWQANAAVQETEVAGLRANIIAANAAIVTANAAVVSYVNSQTALVEGIITATNAAIVTANAGAVAYANGLNSAMAANVTAANASIVTTNNALITANTAVVNYVNTLHNSLVANLNAANAAIAVSAGNFANLVAGAPGILNTLVEIDQSLGNNASLSTTLLSNIAAINANVTAANAAIVTANAAVVSYINTLISADSANVAAANAAIVTANAAVVSYVNTQVSSLQSNAATQETEVSGLRANITAANAAIVTLQTEVYSNANVAAYLLTNTGNISVGNVVYKDGSHSNSAKWTLVESFNISSPTTIQTLTMSNALSYYTSTYNDFYVRVRINNGEYVYQTTLPTALITTGDDYVVGTSGVTGNVHMVKWSNTSSYVTYTYGESSTLNANVYIYAR